MLKTGDVWGLGGVGDWVGVSDGGGAIYKRNPFKNNHSPKNEIPSNFI